MNIEPWAPLLLALVIVGWLGLFAGSVLLEARIFRHLRDHHAAAWEKLGQPTPFRRLRRDRAAVAFFRSGEHRRLGDSKLEKMVRAQKVLGWAYRIAFATFLVLLFASARP